MNNVPGRDRFDFEKMSGQWRLLTLRLIGTIGAVGLCIQLIIFPIFQLPISGTACQYCLGAGLGLPIAGLLKGSQKE